MVVLSKEAFFLGTPCLTLRDTTEWLETVEAGRNRLIGAETSTIAQAVREWRPPADTASTRVFGDGHAAERIVELIERQG